jgi:hypothetical protein
MLCAKVRHVLKSCFILITRTPPPARAAFVFMARRNMIYGSFYARRHLQRRARPPLNIYLLLDWARRKYENGLFDGARQPVTQSAHVKTSAAEFKSDGEKRAGAAGREWTHAGWAKVREMPLFCI